MDVVVCNGYIKRLYIEGSRIIYKEEQLEKIKVLDNFIQEYNLIVSPGQVLIKRKSIPQFLFGMARQMIDGTPLFEMDLLMHQTQN